MTNAACHASGGCISQTDKDNNIEAEKVATAPHLESADRQKKNNEEASSSGDQPKKGSPTLAGKTSTAGTYRESRFKATAEVGRRETSTKRTGKQEKREIFKRNKAEK